MNLLKCSFVFRVIPIIFVLIFLIPHSSLANAETSLGQVLYVPVYSNVYSGPQNRAVNLTAVVSIRNVDPESDIEVHRVDYYDTEGKFIKSYINQKINLKAFSVHEFIVDESDTSGGSGAKFIIEWRVKGDRPVNTPIVEAIMLTTRSGLGVSFVTRGKEITHAPKRK